MSGELSENIRQDTFTKQVGVWTNPLKRIIPNFYQDYVKMLQSAQSDNLPVLLYDELIGAFIFGMENRSFSLFKPQSVSKLPSISSKGLPQMNINLPWKTILIFLLSFGLTFALIFGAFKMNVGKVFHAIQLPGVTKPTATPTLTPVPPTATPTPTPELKKAEVKIKVLNGTGISGKAARVKALLKEKEYGEILTGNAGATNYTITEIQLKARLAPFESAILADLAENVEKPKITTDLEETEASDMIIIIGRDFK